MAVRAPEVRQAPPGYRDLLGRYVLVPRLEKLGEVCDRLALQLSWAVCGRILSMPPCLREHARGPRGPRSHLPLRERGLGHLGLLAVLDAGASPPAAAAELHVAGALSGLVAACPAADDHHVVAGPVALDQVHEVVAMRPGELRGTFPAQALRPADHALLYELAPRGARLNQAAHRAVVERVRAGVPAEPVACPADRLAGGVLVEDVLQPVVRLGAAALAGREDVLVLAVRTPWVVRLVHPQPGGVQNLVELGIRKLHVPPPGLGA